jgi:Mg2+ and Co2+ transporter CorA
LLGVCGPLTKRQLNSIINVKAENKVQRTLEDMQNITNSLHKISGHTQQQAESLVNVALQNHRDSKIIKTLSKIATMYLPASLIAVSEYIR